MEQALTNKDCHILKEQWGQFSVGEALKGSKNQIKHGKSQNKFIKDFHAQLGNTNIPGQEIRGKGRTPKWHQNLIRKIKASESRLAVSDSWETTWTIQFMKFSRPEYWSVQPFPSPRDLSNSGIEPRSPTLQGGFFTS